MPPIKKFLVNNWPLLLILLLAVAALVYKIDKPFWGHHDWNGVYWGAVARNYVRYGLLATKFAMVPGNGVQPLDQLGYSFHYAPLFALIWAGFFWIFGVHNWVSRSMAISFSLATIIVFFFLVKKYFGLKTAVLSLIFWIVTPMFLYFGKMPVHEIPLMVFVLLAFWFYLSGKFRWLLVATIIAELITWPGYFIVPAVTLHWFLFKKINSLKSKQVLILWLSSFLLFAIFLLHNFLVTGSIIGGGVRETFLLRIGGVSPIQYVSTLIRWSWTYYFLLIPLSLTWLIKRGKRFDIPLLFLIYAVIYPIIFRDASFRHDYLLIYFWPFLCLTSALVLQKRLFLVILILASFLVFRGKFVLALFESSLYRESVRVGEFVGPRTNLGDKVLIVVKDPSVPFDGWFSSYYSDRPVRFATEEPKELDGQQVFFYFPGGKMSAGADTSSSGTK